MSITFDILLLYFLFSLLLSKLVSTYLCFFLIAAISAVICHCFKAMSLV